MTAGRREGLSVRACRSDALSNDGPHHSASPSWCEPHEVLVFRISPRSSILAAGLSLAVLISASTVLGEVQYFEVAVDLHIPLAAATRLLAGGSPYLSASFGFPAGAHLPFLYPPYVLPLFGLLSIVPGTILDPVWIAAGFLAAIGACRRLAVPWPVIPIAFLWPPFFEGLITGNVQLFLFVAFAALFWDGRGARPFSPRRRDIKNPEPAKGFLNGLAATAVGAVKISQVHAWLYLFRVRPADAARAGMIVVLIALLTLPMVGVDSWFSWFAQLQRAADPNWIAIGAPLSVIVGPLPAFAVTASSIAAIRFIDHARAGAWIGLLIVLGSPSVHTHTFLFMLPAILLVRREIGLTALILIATGNPIAIWLGVAAVGWSLAAGSVWPALYEPASRDSMLAA